jgi:hypothetical protein
MSENNSYLHSLAIASDRKIEEDAWSTSFNNILFSTDNFASSINTYIGGVSTAFTDWEEVVATVLETTGGSLDELNTKIGTDGITGKANALAKALLGDNKDGKGGVAGALSKVLEECQKAVTYYNET